MTGQKICSYYKFGFCRLRSQCPNIHLRDVCEKDTCDVQNCNKRHPVPCRLFAQGECKFNQGCMFSHRKPQKLIDLEAKMKSVEKDNLNLKLRCNNQDSTIEVLKQKILSMESNLMVVMKIVHQNICEKSGSENLANRKIEYEENLMDFESTSDTESPGVTSASDDKVKISGSSLVAGNKLINDDANDLSFIENEILKIKEYVLNERMTKNNVEKCKKKFGIMRKKIKLMKMNTEKGRVLVTSIEEIFEKLDKTIFSSFKKVTICEVEKILKALKR